MAERPNKNKNILARQLVSYSPNFRIDTVNPQMGLSGTDVYKIYGVTDDGIQSSISLSSGGLFSIKNDNSFEVIAGEKNQGQSVDIIIVGKNGDIALTAEKTGMVRIRANNIVLDANEDITLKAGRNINQESGSGRILQKANKIDVSALTGNVIASLGLSFGMKVFEGSFVGGDILTNVFGTAVDTIIDTVL
jgi:hypothetical protein